MLFHNTASTSISHISFVNDTYNNSAYPHDLNIHVRAPDSELSYYCHYIMTASQIPK